MQLGEICAFGQQNNHYVQAHKRQTEKQVLVFGVFYAHFIFTSDNKIEYK